MTQSTRRGEDTPDAWNDRHLQHVYLWLTTNPNSPYRGSPSMLFTAMKIDKRYWNDFRKAFNRGIFDRYRFSVRLGLTASLKRVLAGYYVPIVLQKNRLNRVIRYSVHEAVEKVPLPCPPFYVGGIRITTKGLQLSLKRTDELLAPKHDPEGVSRLTNAFGAR